MLGTVQKGKKSSSQIDVVGIPLQVIDLFKELEGSKHLSVLSSLHIGIHTALLRRNAYENLPRLGQGEKKKCLLSLGKSYALLLFFVGPWGTSDMEEQSVLPRESEKNEPQFISDDESTSSSAVSVSVPVVADTEPRGGDLEKTLSKSTQKTHRSHRSRWEQQITSAVDWTGDDDPDNPLNWSRAKKIYHVLIPAFQCFTMYVPLFPLAGNPRTTTWSHS